MNEINQNLKRYNYPNQVSMQSLGQSQLAPNAVSMEGDQVKENPMMTMLFDENFDAKDRKLTWMLTGPILIGLFKLMSLFSWANKGEYDKSFVGRLANWGDQISNGRLAKSKFGTFVSDSFNKAGNLGKKIVSKSKILTAIFKMPTIPEARPVKDMLTGSREEITSKFVSFVDKYIGKDISKLSDLGLTEQQYQAIKANPVANMDLIKDTCKNVGNRYTVKFDNYLGKITNRSVTLEQIGNELKAITEPASKLGRFLPKAAIRGLHGLTFGGGLFMLLSAFSLAKAIPTTKKAEKGDKFPTFMEEFLGNISWVITMPWGIKLMNAIGGLKNMGMTPEILKEFRKKLEIHNATNFTSEAEWKKSYDALMKLKNSEKIGFFNKIFRGIGKFIGAGREVIKPYIRTGSNLSNMDKFKNFLAHAKFKGLNWLAYPIGFLTYMFIFAPVVDKLFVGASHLVFGKPKHSKHDEPKNNEPEQNLTPAQNVQPNPFDNATMEHDSPTNLINMRQNGQTYTPYGAETVKNKDNYSYVPSPEGVGKENKGNVEPERTYIPSPAGVKLNGPDPTLANQALMRADAAERAAMEALSMRW